MGWSCPSTMLCVPSAAARWQTVWHYSRHVSGDDCLRTSCPLFGFGRLQHFDPDYARSTGHWIWFSPCANPFVLLPAGPWKRKIELSLSLTGLSPFFKGRIFSSYEVGSWKPDPGLFLHAARVMGVAPADCAVLEDSLLGIRAGLAAGMTVFAFQPYGVDPSIPSQVTVVKELRELCGIFRQSAAEPGVAGRPKWSRDSG